jgi:hypothetical protein
MSYIRNGHPYRYVDGNSDDYIFPTKDSENEPTCIKDYNHISNNTIMEFVCFLLKDGHWVDDELFVEYVIQHLAEKLGVKLRPKKLSVEEWSAVTERLMEEFKQTDFYKELFPEGDENDNPV